MAKNIDWMWKSRGYSFIISLRTVLLPAPMPPPINSSTGLLSLRATGAMTSVQLDSPSPRIAFISRTNVEKTLVTFKSLVTFSNLRSLSHQIENPSL